MGYIYTQKQLIPDLGGGGKWLQNFFFLVWEDRLLTVDRQDKLLMGLRDWMGWKWRNLALISLWKYHAEFLFESHLRANILSID